MQKVPIKKIGILIFVGDFLNYWPEEALEKHKKN